MLREYDNTKEEIKSLKTSTVYQRFYYNCKTILSYCLKCRKNMEIKNPRVAKIKRGKPMLKKSRFIKEQEASGLLLSSNSPFKGFPMIGSFL